MFSKKHFVCIVGMYPLVKIYFRIHIPFAYLNVFGVKCIVILLIPARYFFQCYENDLSKFAFAKTVYYFNG